MSHLEEGLLHALLDGEIASAELPPIQAHLAACAECRARLEEEREFRAEADGLVEMVEVPAPGSGEGRGISARPKSGTRAGRRWRDLAWAASLVAAVGLGYAAHGWRAPGAAPPTAPSETLTQSAAKEESDKAMSQPPPASKPVSAFADRAESREGVTRMNRRIAPPPMRERSETSVVGPRLEAKLSAAEPAAGVTGAAAPANLAATPPPAPTVAASQGVRDQAKPEQFRLDEVVVMRGAGGRLGMAKLAATPASRPDTISFQDALSRLGGAMRLIEGLVPVRLEGQGVVVFVVYPVRGGELLLAQQRVDGRLEYRLIAPPDFPADSLERLRARVRE